MYPSYRNLYCNVLTDESRFIRILLSTYFLHPKIFTPLSFSSVITETTF